MNALSSRSVGSLRPGDHVCFAYDSDAEHEAVLSSFVVDGLERNERVLCFSDDQPPAQILTKLERRGVDTSRHIGRGQLTIATACESYLAMGSFDPAACIEGWYREAGRAIADGYSGIRVAGDMAWVMRGVPGAELLLDYEKRIQAEVFPSRLVTGMCEIDRRRFDESAAQALMGVHPDGEVRADPLFSDGCVQVVPTFEPFGAKVFGEIDVFSAEEFERAIRRLGAPGGPDVVLDFGGVRFMGAQALSALVRCAQDLEYGRRLVLCNMPAKFRRIMTLMGWQDVPRLAFADACYGAAASETELQ